MILKKSAVIAATAALVAGLTLPTPAFAVEASQPATEPTNGATTAEQHVEAEYHLQVGDQVIILAEGEKATFPLAPVDPETGEVDTQGTWTGDWGTLTTWGGGGRFHWEIAMSRPATNFAGNARITNITSGLSAGRTAVTGFAGSARYTALSGHIYSGSIDGTAYLAGVPVATTMFNSTQWRG